MTLNSTKYQLRILDPGEYSLWDRFILDNPQATIFQSTLWGNIIHSVFGRDFEILTIWNNENLYGGLLYFPKYSLSINTIPLVPVTTYQSIVFKTSSAEKTSSIISEEHELTNTILEKLRQEFDYIDIFLTHNIQDIRPYKWNNFKSEPHYTYCFPLNDFDVLKQQFNQALRRKINASIKENNEIIESSDTVAFVNLVEESYRYHKIKPPISETQIEVLVNSCIEQNLGKLFYLRVNQKPVAGLFVLVDEKRVYALFSGIQQLHRGKHFTEYLHTSVFQRPDFQGKEFDFLGANTKTFEQFKRSFGGQLKLYFRVNYFKNMRTHILFKIREKQHLLSRTVPGKHK